MLTMKKLNLSPGEYYGDPPDVSQLKIEYSLGLGPWVNFQKPGEFNPIHNHLDDELLH